MHISVSVRRARRPMPRRLRGCADGRGATNAAGYGFKDGSGQPRPQYTAKPRPIRRAAALTILFPAPEAAKAVDKGARGVIINYGRRGGRTANAFFKEAVLLSGIVIYIILGFLAELIDGTMGMAYGVSSNTFLRGVGVPSAVSSACVHISEIFTTLVSGISHLKLKNVDRGLFLKLLVPGCAGGALGAYLLVSFSSAAVDIIIDLYLIVMGAVIFSKIFRKPRAPREYGNYAYGLGFAGGFTDAMGGGGWGPVVTSTLLASGHDARRTIGTVNTAEFFVTVAETTTFAAMIGDFRAYTAVILGLIIGGVIAAPIGAKLCTRIPARHMLGIVGALVVFLNICKLLQHTGVL
jgi:uncharacterized membrane protein YfcA